MGRQIGLTSSLRAPAESLCTKNHQLRVFPRRLITPLLPLLLFLPLLPLLPLLPMYIPAAVRSRPFLRARYWLRPRTGPSGAQQQLLASMSRSTRPQKRRGTDLNVAGGHRTSKPLITIQSMKPKPSCKNAQGPPDLLFGVPDPRPSVRTLALPRWISCATRPRPTSATTHWRGAQMIDHFASL